MYQFSNHSDILISSQWHVFDYLLKYILVSLKIFESSIVNRLMTCLSGSCLENNFEKISLCWLTAYKIMNNALSVCNNIINYAISKVTYFKSQILNFLYLKVNVTVGFMSLMSAICSCVYGYWHVCLFLWHRNGITYVCTRSCSHAAWQRARCEALLMSSLRTAPSNSWRSDGTA